MKWGVVFLLISIVFIYCSIKVGYIFIVFSIWNLLSAFFYFFNMHYIFKKRRNGTIPFLSLVIFFPIVFMNFFILIIYRVLFPDKLYHKIDENLFLGGRAFWFHVKKIKQDNIDVIFDLTAEFWETKKIRDGFIYKTIPIMDTFGVTQERLVDGVNFINDFINKNKRVYIHCAYGHSRSLLFLIATIMKKDGNKDWEAIFRKVKKIRKKIHLTSVQIKTLKEFSKNIV
ncbi:dual specificity protein phosphatase family protein [bacterium]|nr:dual specificity protein phosphatase family protein [bacterium]